MRGWWVMTLGAFASVACTSDSDDDATPDETGSPNDTGSPVDTEPDDTGMPDPGPLEVGVLTLEGDFELRGTTWTGTERLVLELDDFINPKTLCVIAYDVTGMGSRDDCAECNASPEGMGGAETFMTSNARIESEGRDGACAIVLAADTVKAADLSALDSRTLNYGWGEEPFGHGYALYELNDEGTWFVRGTMRMPFEDDGTFMAEGLDARITFSFLEGTYDL